MVSLKFAPTILVALSHAQSPEEIRTRLLESWNQDPPLTVRFIFTVKQPDFFVVCYNWLFTHHLPTAIANLGIFEERGISSMLFRLSHACVYSFIAHQLKRDLESLAYGGNVSDLATHFSMGNKTKKLAFQIARRLGLPLAIWQRELRKKYILPLKHAKKTIHPQGFQEVEYPKAGKWLVAIDPRTHPMSSQYGFELAKRCLFSKIFPFNMIGKPIPSNPERILHVVSDIEFSLDSAMKAYLESGSIHSRMTQMIICTNHPESIHPVHQHTKKLFEQAHRILPSVLVLNVSPFLDSVEWKEERGFAVLSCGAERFKEIIPFLSELDLSELHPIQEHVFERAFLAWQLSKDQDVVIRRDQDARPKKNRSAV